MSLFPTICCLEELLEEEEHIQWQERIETIRSFYLNSLYFLPPEEKIIVWGSKEMYEELRDIFTNHEIAVLIDEDSNRQGMEIHGIRVSPPDVLHRLPNHPIFICSRQKPKILKIIQRNYPQFDTLL